MYIVEDPRINAYDNRNDDSSNKTREQDPERPAHTAVSPALASLLHKPGISVRPCISCWFFPSTAVLTQNVSRQDDNVKIGIDRDNTYWSFNSGFASMSSHSCTATEKRFQNAGSLTPDIFEWICPSTAIKASASSSSSSSSLLSSCLMAMSSS